jgi:hypothetical protein
MSVGGCHPNTVLVPFTWGHGPLETNERGAYLQESLESGSFEH